MTPVPAGTDLGDRVRNGDWQALRLLEAEVARLTQERDTLREGLQRMVDFDGVSDWNGWRNFSVLREMAEDALRASPVAATTDEEDAQ